MAAMVFVQPGKPWMHRRFLRDKTWDRRSWQSRTVRRRSFCSRNCQWYCSRCVGAPGSASRRNRARSRVPFVRRCSRWSRRMRDLWQRCCGCLSLMPEDLGYISWAFPALLVPLVRLGVITRWGGPLVRLGVITRGVDPLVRLGVITRGVDPLLWAASRLGVGVGHASGVVCGWI